jgi:polyketide cyclase/dehydrase/lipid transport protein
MRFSCHPVDASFFDTAPMRFKNVVDLDARLAEVFAIFEDGESWPKWFSGMQKVVWTSNKPHGVGTTRTVWLGLITLDERFFRWEQDRRFSFYLTGHSMPLAHALAEDYLLEEFVPGKTRFTYSVAIEPRLALSMGGPIARAYFSSMFRNACKSLQSYVLKAVMPAAGRKVP